MEVIDFEVKLFDVTSLAADGSNIPKRSCEEYITSPDYRTIIRDKVAIGGVTHKDRKLSPEYKGLVGMDDQVLINNNATHYITGLYFKDGSNFFYASAQTFDPELFAGVRRDNIINLMGLLQSGVRLPVSVVIQALWSKRGTAEKIIRIKGFDFTQNPSFKGAGDIHTFSEVMEDNEEVPEEELKSFSEFIEKGDLVLQTRIYSSDGEVSILEDDSIIKNHESNKDNIFGKILANDKCKAVTYSDVVDVYGQDSPQVKLITPYQGKILTRDDLNDIQKKSTNDDDETEYWMARLKKMTDDGDKDILQMFYRSRRDKFLNIIHSVPTSDPNREKLIEARLRQFFKSGGDDPIDPDKNSIYSTVASVSDRLRIQTQPRYVKINRIMMSYKNYYNSKKLDGEQLYKCKLLFLQDINLLIKEVLKEIKSGLTLNSLYGLNRYGKDIKNSSLKLSKTYRKLLIAENIMKFVPKALYNEWAKDLAQFYQSMMVYTFGDGLTEDEINIIDLVK
jgi:hypothetical protein